MSEITIDISKALYIIPLTEFPSKRLLREERSTEVMDITGESHPTGGNIPPSRQETIEYMVGALRRAVEAVTGDPNLDPLAIFPDPKAAGVERWEDVHFSIGGGEPDDVRGQRELAFRRAMAEIGPGREADRDADSAGLRSGYTAIIEAGQGHKIITELDLVFTSGDARPGFVFIAASPTREVKGTERATTASVMGLPEEEVGATEYDVARQIALRLPTFRQVSEEDLGAGYSVSGEVTEGPAGQLLHIGDLEGGVPVILMRIDREEGEAGKFRQLDDAGKMRVVAELMRRQGSTGEVGFVTSATYEPSRELDALTVERETGRHMAVVSYGAARLAAVRGEAIVVTPPSLGQLAGQAYQTAQRLQEISANFREPLQPDAP